MVWHEMSAGIVDALIGAGLDPVVVRARLSDALDEDLEGGVDVTSVATVPSEQRSVMDIVARETGVVAGIPVAAAVFEMVGGSATDIAAIWIDGDAVSSGDVVMQVVGGTRALLTAERTALNMLCHLSGIATATANWVEAVAGTDVRVRDTRKTTPGLRALEKYAVRSGGGMNHRMSLSDAALVKDNHVAAIGGVAAAFAAVRERFPGLPVEVEVDSLGQLSEVLDAGADLVLLDNFEPQQMEAAVGINAGRARLEASGGLSLADAKSVAATGVDYIAVGALTHSAPALDFGADLDGVSTAGPNADPTGADGS
jgi:nicotinate-nucleotide pyrophosphorylase (carboxylating)